jgi:Prp8 binding protein
MASEIVPSSKRPASPPANGALVVKRQRTDGELGTAEQPIKRTSSLRAPIMLLTGHSSEVFTLKFSPSGNLLASGSHDKHVLLWNTYGECENFMVLKGHKNAVVELHWTSDGERVVTASPDKSVRAWDVASGQQVKKMAEHDSFVNSCCPLRRGPPLLVSGSDDGTAKVWDMRVKRSVQTLPEKYQVCAVAFADAGDQVYTGGIDNTIKVWDLRKEEVSFTLEGHGDTITGMRVSPDGNHLLTNSMDNTLRVWDVRPYATANRCTKVFTGHQHTFEKNLLKCDWSADGKKVTAGSGDKMVYVWDVASRHLLYKLPGHTGSVNETAFHPNEPIIGSAASDKNIYLGELTE